MKLVSLLCASLLICSAPFAQNRPAGLMTDLVTDAGALYRDGYRLDNSVAEASEAELGDCRFAAIRSSRPTFGWIVPDCGRGTRQRSYRIIVADNAADAAAHRGNVWDSGEVRSAQSTAVVYGGGDLSPDRLYFWSVRVVTDTGGRSEWSAAEPFRTSPQLSEYAPSYRPQICERDSAVAVKRLDSSTVFFDFGRASFGSVEVTLQSPRDGDTVYVAIGEAVRDGRIDSRPPGTVRYYRYPLVLKAGRHAYRVIPDHDRRNTGPQAVLMPDHIGEVAPFRYCQVENCRGGVEVAGAVRHTTVYPFDEAAARFSSDDPTLNAVWDLCKYSIKATSALGIYIDGDRERIPYEADAVINQLGHYAVDREYAMARRSSEYLLAHPTWPTEWILQALIIAWNDYMYTGDARSIEANFDLLRARTLGVLRRDNGLISTTVDKTVESDAFRRSINFGGTVRDIVDWPRGSEDDGFVFSDYNCVVNAFHYRAMRILARMADVLGRRDEAREIDAECDRFRDIFNDAFFDPDAGAYRDGIGVDHHSMHASLFAAALGLVPDEHRGAVLDHIRSRDMACSVYAAQFLLDALYDAGDGDYALHMLTKRDKRSWYNMLACGATITFEAWDDSFKPNQDWNHAWGAAPANIIPRRLVGVEPLTPACEVISVRPQVSSLRHVAAVVPTVRGGVEVEIDNTPDSYRMRVVVPPNTVARISLPAVFECFTLECNGAFRRARRGRGSAFIDAGEVPSGEYLFEMRPSDRTSVSSAVAADAR